MKTSNGTINNGTLVTAMLVCLAGCTGEYAEQYASVDAAEPDSNAAKFSESLKDEASIAQAYSSEEEGLDYGFALSTLPVKGQRDCLWGSSDCNRCVHNVAAQLDALSSTYTGAIRFQYNGRAIDGPGLNDAYEHVQSIGRLPNIGNDEYMVFTYSTASNSKVFGGLDVVRMGANQNSDGYAFGGMSSGAGSDSNTQNRDVSATSTKNNHPGGLSVMGSYVYLAQWCQEEGNHSWCSNIHSDINAAGFSIYDLRHAADSSVIGSNPPTELNYQSVFKEDWYNKTNTASIAATKLANGKYLLALGKRGGLGYGFYTSSSPSGDFDFINSDSLGTTKGQNANFLTECETGDLYMVEIDRYTAGIIVNNEIQLVELSQVQSYRVVGDSTSGYFLSYNASHDFDCGNWCDLDAGAGFHITPSGDLILYATQKDTTSAGNLRMAEFTGLNTPYVLPVPIVMAIL